MKAIYKSIFFILVSLLWYQSADAQWQLTYGPTGTLFRPIQCFAQSGNNYFAGTFGDGVWKSSDNSQSAWIKVNSGLTGKLVSSLLAEGTNLLAGADSGLFLSTNYGDSWTEINTGFTFKWIPTIVKMGNKLFAGGGGLLVSTDGGFGWNTVNTNGLTYAFISYLAVIGTDLFAGTTGGGVFRSSDYGENWITVNNGLSSTNIKSLVAAGNYLYAAAGTNPIQIFYSSDYGSNWNITNNGLPSPNETILFSISSSVFTAIANQGVYLTTNNGVSWTEANDGFGFSKNFSAFGVLGQDIFVAHQNGNNYRRPISQLITSIEPLSVLQPTAFELFQNYPNPFNPATKFRFSIPERGFVTLKIFDAFGQEVATLISEELRAGQYEKEWDASYLGIASGVYYYRVQAGNYSQTKKLILTK